MTWRARPVFVSGTFRDMHEERDLLAARAFPELAEKLGEHFTVLERVDLRVGVEARGLGDDHAKQELVLKVCLEDVKRCRPFLIVLVGDRYGWVPPLDRAKAATDEAGLHTKLEGKSVTALEIEYGLLADRDQQTRSRIYFRKLDYTEMDVDSAIVYSDERAAAYFGKLADDASLPADTRTRAAKERDLATERAAALETLKTKLRTNLGPRCGDYVASWDRERMRVTGLGPLVAKVVRELLPEMVAEAKEQVAVAKAGKLPMPLEQFVAERARGFRGRAAIMRRLSAHATSRGEVEKRGLVVVGASGGGKSAVFARVYEELLEKQAKGNDFVLLAHAAGIDPRSTSVSGLVEDWIGKLAENLGVPNPLAEPADGETRQTSVHGADKRPKPEEVFEDLLARAAARGRVVLLLDALDRFERTGQAEQLTWLPQRLPANVRLIATAVPGSETHALAQRTDFALETLEALTKDEAREIAESVYARYHRQPNRDAVETLVEKPGPGGAPAHGNALWLVSALEELNLLDGDDFRRAEAGKEGTDEDRLHAMIVGEAREIPGDVEALYARVFERAGRRVSDDPGEGRALARAFVVVIALSRGGFRERDLAALIPDVAQLLDPAAPPMGWDALGFAALRRSLRAHLVRRGTDDRWHFHHRQARMAGVGAYARDAVRRQRIHELLADHLLALPADDPLREGEAMHHLIEAGAREKAGRLYAGELTPGGFAGCSETLAQHALSEAGLAWVMGLLEIETLGPDVLMTLGERYLSDLDVVFRRMYLTAPRDAAAQTTERLFRDMLAANPSDSRLQRDLSISLYHIGDVEMARGNLDTAFTANAECLQILRGLSDPGRPESMHDLAVSLGGVGQVEMARGNLDGAFTAFAESLQISRGLSDPEQPESLRAVAISVKHVGDVERARGNLDAAFAAYGESLKISRTLFDSGRLESMRDVSVSLDHVGDVERARGNLDAAFAAYGESLKISRTLFDPGRPESLYDMSFSLDRVGEVEMARGNLDAAFAAYGESLKIRRGLSNPGRPESLRNLSVSLDRVARVEMTRDNVDAAIAAYAESLEISRGLLDPGRPESLRSLSFSLNNIGDVEMAQGNLDAAFAAYTESLKIRRGLSDPGRPESLRDVPASLHHIGRVEAARGNLDSAFTAFAEGLKIFRGLSDPGRPESLRDVFVALSGVARIEMARGNLDAAFAAYAESLEIRRGLSDPGRPESLRDVSVALRQVAGIATAKGDRRAAKEHYREALRILTDLERDGKLFPQWRSDLAWLKDHLARLDNEAAALTRVDVPPARSASDADRAAALNIAYQRELAGWKALPFLKRLRTRKPVPPERI